MLHRVLVFILLNLPACPPHGPFILGPVFTYMGPERGPYGFHLTPAEMLTEDHGLVLVRHRLMPGASAAGAIGSINCFNDNESYLWLVVRRGHTKYQVEPNT